MDVLNLVTTEDSSHFQEQLRSLKKEGVNHTVISTSTRTSEPLSEKHIFQYLPQDVRKPIYFVLKSIIIYPRILFEVIFGEYDIVHATSGLVAPFAILQPNRPVVLSFWGSDLMGNYFFGWQKYICRVCAKMSTENIVMSDEMLEKLKTDAHVIPHGIDLNKFKNKNKLECKKDLDWDVNKKQVLFPYDTRRKVKNYELAEHIISCVNNRLEMDVELKVVHGVEHELIPTYMNAADALLITSSREGSPNTTKEAMACNTPVVSTNVGDIKRQLDGVHGSYVCDSKSELVNRLYEIISNETMPCSREKAKIYSLESMGDQIINVYKESMDINT